MSSRGADKSFVIVLILLGLAAAVSWNLYFKEYRQQDTVDIHKFPNEIAGWTAEELPITDKEYEILETRNAFTRKYTNVVGESVYLFIVYSQNNRKVSHPPQVCYTGSGATVVDSNILDVSLESDPFVLKTKKLLVEQGEAQQIVSYWFKVGDSFTPNYWRQQILIALKSFLGQPSSSALIRVSSPVGEQGAEGATQAIKKFVPLVMPHLFKYLP